MSIKPVNPPLPYAIAAAADAFGQQRKEERQPESEQKKTEEKDEKKSVSKSESQAQDDLAHRQIVDSEKVVELLGTSKIPTPKVTDAFKQPKPSSASKIIRDL